MTEARSRSSGTPASWTPAPTPGQRRAQALLAAMGLILDLPKGPSLDPGARLLAVIALAATLLPEPNRLALAELATRALSPGGPRLRAVLDEAREIAARTYA